MKFKWTFVAIALVLFLVFIPNDILYPDYRIITWTIFILIFLGLPYSVYRAVPEFEIPDRHQKTTKKIDKNQNNRRLALTFLVPLIIGPSFGYYIGFKEKKELKKYGQWTKGVVIDKKWNKKRSQSGYWTIKCIYSVGTKKYSTDYESDRNEKFNIGDSIDLIYSTDYPKIHSLKYKWDVE